jgi:hypothetical protein
MESARHGVDALQIDQCDAEVAVSEMALDEVQGHALVRELERMGVSQLVRHEPPARGGSAGYRRPLLRGGRPAR